MITKFVTVYPGHIDMPDRGQDATPANERRFSNEQLAGVFDKTEAVAKTMDRLGYDTLWLAEHHFQHEGYEVIPNLLMVAVHLAHVTKRLKIGCGFNIAPMWHPLRLAEDYAVADILTKGRTVFGLGRGYHTREVETFGARCATSPPTASCSRSRRRSSSRRSTRRAFRTRGKHYMLPPDVPYRGYDLKEITLVPRPIHRRECWQPIVSASQRAMDFMVRHDIKGAVGGGAATMAEGPIKAYQDAAHRAGKNWQLGENLAIGIFFHLAKTREQALREITPLYEEHVKMFAPLGFVPGLTPPQVEAVGRRGGWAAADVPTVEHFMKLGAWFAGTPDDLIAHLKIAGDALSGDAAHQSQHADGHAEIGDAGAVPVGRRAGDAGVRCATLQRTASLNDRTTGGNGMAAERLLTEETNAADMVARVLRRSRHRHGVRHLRRPHRADLPRAWRSSRTASAPCWCARKASAA